MGEENGEVKGEERKNPQRTRRSQFWHDLSHDLSVVSHYNDSESRVVVRHETRTKAMH